MDQGQAAEQPPLKIGGHLTVADATAGSRAPRRLLLPESSRRTVRRSARRIARAVERDEWVYGVTTGFGSNADTKVDESNAALLQRNLLVSHAFGDGPPLHDETVRLALLLRIHALAKGASGIRESTLDALIGLYEHDILAVVPSRGSVGASGDLAPLSHLALPLIGVGRVRCRGKAMSAKTALKRAGLAPVELGVKEGLALVNGMQITLAIALRVLERAECAILTADVTAALTTEALAGRSDALDPRIQAARGHPGQIASAARIRKVLAGSRLVDAPHGAIPGKRRAPQDAYGIRCAPQVHGAVEDGIAYARDAFSREIDAATDNPLVFGDDILSGGNFHGEPLALPADHMRLCVHELGSISERRTATLVDRHMSEGLPPYLVDGRGLHSGFMIPQYVAAALVSESKQMCFPASADSIPTGANIEDHVSMGPIAARRAEDVVELVEGVLAIELLAAAQAIELRDRKPARRSQAVIDLLRSVVPHRSKDAPWADTMVKTRALVRSGQVAAAAGLA